MKTILVTGSNGLLGQKLVYSILKTGNFHCIATARGDNRLLVREGYAYHPMDITKIHQVKEVLELVKPNVIIHTAAMTNVDACETRREECWDMNVNGVHHLVSALEEIQEKNPSYQPHFIHLSTDFIFDGEDGPYDEEAKPNPLSYYALSKWEGEKIVQASKLKWAIVRTIIVYGVVDNMSRSNIILWAKGALEKGQSINVVDDQFRSPTLAEDLAQGCLLIAKKGATGIFNISGKDTMSILELVKRVAAFWNLNASLIVPVKSETLKQPAKRPPRTGFIIEKAKRELGYVPHSFEEGLKIVDEQLGKA